MCCEDTKSLVEEDDNEDCHELDTIYEHIFEFDFEDCDIDDYWAKAYAMDDEGFYRDDSDVFGEREVRVFPTRYRLKDFVFTKRLRRVLNKNRDLKIAVREFRSTEGKDDLYTAHVHNRFQKDKARYSFKDSFKYLRRSSIELMEAAVFNEQKLLACSIFQVSERSVLSSRGFWDVNEPKRSLGILTVLLEIKYALEHGKEFYYLGNYFSQDPNYQYKTQLPALELWDWDNERWVDYKDERIKEMFNHKYRCKDDLDRDPEFTLSLLQNVSKWFPNIIASALVGSRARGTEREDSDFDLIILTNDVESFFTNENKLEKRFHRWRESKVEESGAIKTLRAFYKNGDVFEFNFASPDWANTDPVDEATRRIVKDGMKILYDPQGILENLQKAVLSE